MKKILSVVLVVLMAALMMVPAFAEGNSVTFIAPSEDLVTDCNDTYAKANAAAIANGKMPADPGEPYVFVKSNEGRLEFKEDPNGKYYLADDGYYYTADRIIFDPNDTSPRTTYSPVTYDTDTAITEETVSFKILTNDVYNAATVTVYVNGEVMYPDSIGEYKLRVDRALTVKVEEASLMRNHFFVKLTSGEGYSVRNIIGESAHYALYGDEFRFRVKIGSGYSDADLKVVLLRGGNDLAEFIGDDLDEIRPFIDPNSAETLVSDGVDAEGARTYTIKNVTTDCKILVSGVRTQKKADILTYLKRLLKMLLDALHIDSSFLGLTEMVAYRDVMFDDSALDDAPEGTDYILLSGIFDEFKPNNERTEGDKTYGYFTVMNGESVTVRLTTRDQALKSTLGVKWKIGDNDWTSYPKENMTWTAAFDVSTGYVYYSTTIQIDNITAKTYITLVK